MLPSWLQATAVVDQDLPQVYGCYCKRQHRGLNISNIVLRYIIEIYDTSAMLGRWDHICRSMAAIRFRACLVRWVRDRYKIVVRLQKWGRFRVAVFLCRGEDLFANGGVCLNQGRSGLEVLHACEWQLVCRSLAKAPLLNSHPRPFGLAC